VIRLVCWALLGWLGTQAVAQPYTFPLRASPDRRFLVDQRGQPFLYVSDAAWQLFVGLPLPEVREYFLLRKRQGFSVIHAQLTYTPMPGADNLEGQLPFANFDFDQPNERYFAHIDRVVALADSLNLVMALAPLWYSCCNDGWGSNPVKHLQNNGQAKCRNFGRYLGRRYQKFNNFIWIMGGDNDPFDNLAEVRALAQGLKEAAPHHLLTYHAASTHSSTDVWPSEAWLDFSMVYTYFRGFAKAWTKVQPDVYEVAYTEHRKNLMPFVLGESTYEGEHDDVCNSSAQARKQAYYTMLAGGCGHSYGSRFWTVADKKARGYDDWRKIVDQPAANSLAHLNALWATFDWPSLVPDQLGELIAGGANPYASNDYALAAHTKDRRLALAYLPSGRRLVYDLRGLAGKRVTASWYNPRTGAMTRVGQYARTQTVELAPPDANDWVLHLKAD
jgi:hypothetical protein